MNYPFVALKSQVLHFFTYPEIIADSMTVTNCGCLNCQNNFINYRPAMTMFIGGTLTIFSHGWGLWRFYTHIYSISHFPYIGLLKWGTPKSSISMGISLITIQHSGILHLWAMETHMYVYIYNHH